MKLKSSRQFVLPTATLTLVRQALRKEAGSLGATHALHGAGYAVGRPMLDEFRKFLGGVELTEIGAAEFWDRISDFFTARGWGSFSHDRVHPGMALVTSEDWVEADDMGTEAQPGCAFTCGILAFLLSEVAGGPIAVLEVSCRSRGDESCRFLFGSEAAVHEAYGLLLDGLSLDRALARI